MEQRSDGSGPVARLRQERWQDDGRLEGVLLERWRRGRVEGLTLMSVAGRQEVAAYAGEMTVAPSCLATIRQKDALGDVYNYRAVLLADGGGYFYLQTIPDDLTVGWLER